DRRRPRPALQRRQEVIPLPRAVRSPALVPTLRVGTHRRTLRVASARCCTSRAAERPAARSHAPRGNEGVVGTDFCCPSHHLRITSLRQSFTCKEESGMRTWNVLFAVLVAGPIPSLRAEEKKSAVDEKAVDAIVHKALKDFEAPGAAVAIVKDDKVVYLKG